MDDFDVFTSIKEWMRHPDFILSHLCKGMVNRKLYKIKLQENPFSEEEISFYRNRVLHVLPVTEDDLSYFVFTGEIENSAYTTSQENIHILFRGNIIKDIAMASDNLSISALSQKTVKNYLCVDQKCL